MTGRFYQKSGPAAYNRLMIKNVEHQGITDCLEISNGDARLVISTGFGPRILFYGYDDGENILGWHPDAAVETAIGTWKPYGGHRLWVAPENMPLSYDPDNDLVEHESIGELSAVFRSPAGSGYRGTSRSSGRGESTESCRCRARITGAQQAVSRRVDDQKAA